MQLLAEVGPELLPVQLPMLLADAAVHVLGIDEGVVVGGGDDGRGNGHGNGLEGLVASASAAAASAAPGLVACDVLDRVHKVGWYVELRFVSRYRRVM